MAEENIDINLNVKGGDNLSSELGKGEQASKSLALAAKGVAHEFGVTGGIARMFGHEVAGLAAALGPIGMTIGAIGVAAMAYTKVTEHFADKQKEADKAVLDLSKALESEVSSMEGNTRMTRRQADATYDLYLAKRDLSILLIKDAIDAKNRELEIEGKKYAEIGGMSDAFWHGWFKTVEEFTSKAGKEGEIAAAKLRALNAEVMKMLADQEARRGGPKSKESLGILGEYYGTGEQMDAHVQHFKDMQYVERQMFAAGIAHDEALRQQDLDNQRAYNEESAQMTQKSIDWEAKLFEESEQNKIIMMQGTQEVFGQIYEISGKKMKAFFYLQQLAAASEAYIQYQLAAAKAVGQTGIFGLSMQAYFQAMSYIVPSLIMARSFTGGTTGAQGTFSANPATGLPSTATSGNSSVNLTLIINGQSRNIGDITGDVLRTIYNNNGSVDGLSVAVERSA